MCGMLKDLIVGQVRDISMEVEQEHFDSESLYKSY